MMFIVVPEIGAGEDDIPGQLAEYWIICCEAIDVKPNADMYAQLLDLHREPIRHYHTERHLHALFTDFRRFKVLDPASYWAVWFHDAIYVPGHRDNEVKSAKLAKQSLLKMGVSSHFVEQVEYMIWCTADHNNPKQLYSTQQFLDADMAILGATPLNYHNYMQAVRQEYCKVPAFLFNRGRRAFIKQLLSRERIYGIQEFAREFEQSARNNLNNELLGIFKI